MAALLVPVVVAAAPPEGPDFVAEVRPVLSDACFRCHGPDDGTREGGLRLDLRESAVAPAKSGRAAIVPGDPGASELVRRIFTEDPDDVMPPPSAKHRLTAAQKDTLRRWVEAGAEYRPHWAFVAPRKPDIPVLTDPALRERVRNPVDAFVFAALEERGLRPQPEADRRTLVRRVHLDLIGIPPTPEEADRFEADRSPDAWERLVDSLLASPHYGERWARRWMDLARYADTNGYEKDRPRSIWPWRDWVIRALNADMPFDQFTIEQIAGDMLPGATESQRIATGFHRNTMINEEGGIDPLEFRFAAMVDRVHTTATTWLGLTLACAQCHTHKYDPITHKEYYRFMAFLDNASEPVMEVHDPEIARRRAEGEREIAARVAALPDIFPLPPDDAGIGPETGDESARRMAWRDRRFNEWIGEARAEAVEWTPIVPRKAEGGVPVLRILPDHSVLSTSDISKSDVYTVSGDSPLETITAIRLEALPDPSLPQGGPGRVYYEGPFGDFFLSTFRLLADGSPVAIESADHSFAAGGSPASNAIDDDPQSGWSINGGQGRRHTAVFRLREPLRGAAQLQVEMLFEKYYAAGLGRFRLSVTGDPAARKASAHPDSILALLRRTADSWSEDERDALLRRFVEVAPELQAERDAIDALRRALPAFPTTLVLEERPEDNVRRTFVRHRGEFLQPGEAVSPAIPAVLPPLPPGQPANRLGFARWLVSRNNPLTARVTVNYQWQAIFGRGLVGTPGDFGLQGDLPTHPELLDWLAVEFMDQGWSLKRLHRLIVTSAVYRQSSACPPEMAEADPDNRWLARGPRRRMEGEMVRDSILRAAGLLSPKVGGPGVFPPQPPGVTTEGAYGALEWKVSPGEDRYRRALYTFSKRTTPYAMLATFDGPSGEACTARRDVTNTALQTLTLLNDSVIMDAAGHLGRAVAAIQLDETGKLTWLFRRILTRPPSGEETALLREFVGTQRARLEAGEISPTLAGEDASVESAAWTLAARALINLDEAIVIR